MSRVGKGVFTITQLRGLVLLAMLGVFVGCAAQAWIGSSSVGEPFDPPEVARVTHRGKLVDVDDLDLAVDVTDYIIDDRSATSYGVVLPRTAETVRFFVVAEGCRRVSREEFITSAQRDQIVVLEIGNGAYLQSDPLQFGDTPDVWIHDGCI